MLSTYLSYLPFAIADNSNKGKTQENIDKAIALYWEACKYPRKKKKALRKKAQIEYSFYKNIQNWEKDQPFLMFDSWI